MSPLIDAWVRTRGLAAPVRQCACCRECVWQELEGEWRCPFGGPYAGYRYVILG